MPRDFLHVETAQQSAMQAFCDSLPSPRSAEAGAENGTAFLDRFFPGWAVSLKLEKFDIESQFHCVLAQLFRSYSAAKRQLGLDVAAYWKLGFAAPAYYSSQELNAAWRTQITARAAP